jgi:HD-GYP domain-containing protein (c-di-GMP phosphodiesterase class II)
MAAIREHPRYTHQILSRVACFSGIVETAANHHERLDGKGYHRGLSAFDLTRPARILAVADIFEALTADRPYREAMPRERALAIVREQRGSGLCPVAVDALEAAAHGWTADLLGSESDARVRPPLRRPA